MSKTPENAHSGVGHTIRRAWWTVSHSPAANPIYNGPVVFVIILLLFALFGPASRESFLMMSILIYAVAALGLNIPAGFGGALSLGQGASFAIGAYTAGALTVFLHWPFWATLPVAAVFGLVFGVLLGSPAGRLGEIGLALISLGAVLITGDLALVAKDVTGGVTGLSPIVPYLSFEGSAGASPWLLALIVTVGALLAYLVHYRVRVSTVGRSAMASRDDAIGAIALGISPYRSKVTTFAIGSGFGAFAGGLFAYQAQFISVHAFTVNLSIVLLAMVILGGSGSLYGPLLGAAILVILPQELAQYPHANNLVYGAILIAVVLLRPGGIIRRNAAPVRDVLLSAPTGGTAPAAAVHGGDHGSGLEVKNISRSFGGVRALDGVSFTVRPGEVLGLIGPNGSGKTTAINVITGMYPADDGQILLDGKDITRIKARRIAGAGVARTFQTPKTFPGMSVAEHLLLAKRLQTGGGDGHAEKFDPWVRRLLTLGGIDPDDPRMLERESRSLGHGQLRFLEIAMAIRHAPRVLLLDEPAAGLSHSEMEGLEQVTRELADLGIAVVIVEHHLDLIMRLTDRVTVLDLGTVLWEGEPGDLLTSESVKAAYLGGAS